MASRPGWNEDISGPLAKWLFVVATFPAVVAPYLVWRLLWPPLRERLGRWAWLAAWTPFVLFSLLIFTAPSAVSNAVIPHTDPSGQTSMLWFAAHVFVFASIVFAPAYIAVFVARGSGLASELSTHGSARWATLRDLQAGLLPRGHKGGMLLGRVPQRVSKKFDSRYRVESHILTCAPTGSGKGLGCVVPNLIEYPGSVFVLDVKGENWAVTARARGLAGSECIAVDPFGLTGQPKVAIDLLSGIDPLAEECVSASASLVDTIVVRSNKSDPHWDESAASLLQGLILHAATLSDERRHLGTVRDILMLPAAKLLATMETLSEDPAAFGFVARAANAFLAKADRERSSVLSTAQRHTAWLDDPRLIRTMQGGNGREMWDLQKLKVLNASLYLCIPPDKLEACRGWVRVMLGSALKAMTQDRRPLQHPVLFLVDEMPTLGHFQPLEDGISLLRGYGVRFWLLVQDLSQLQAVYPKWQSFLANSVLQVFGTQDHFTAKHISEMLGQSTISVTSSGTSHSDGYGSTSSSSTSTNSAGRALLQPDEVRRLGTHEVLVFQQGLVPARLRRLDYLTDPECAGLFDANPMIGGQMAS